jgi:hypothetical protein
VPLLVIEQNEVVLPALEVGDLGARRGGLPVILGEVELVLSRATKQPVIAAAALNAVASLVAEQIVGLGRTADVVVAAPAGK